MGNPLTWTYDAPDGVYKNHAMSGKLMEESAKKLVFVPFTQKVDGYGRHKGESVDLIHVKELDIPANNGQLDERTRIPIDSLEMGTNRITVKEWGRGVEYMNLFEQLSVFNPKQPIQKVLINQMSECMDNGAAAAFKEAKICFIPTSLTGGVWDTDGTPSTQALVNMTKDHLGVIRDYMANDLHVPFYEGDNYIGIFATKGLRGLKDDRVIEAWNMYLRKGDLIFKSEAGRCEQVRLIESVNAGALTNGVGSSNVLGEGVVFGDEAVARAEVDFPELRANPNYQGDFGRRKAVSWYGIIAFGPFWITANDREAKIVYVTSQ